MLWVPDTRSLVLTRPDVLRSSSGLYRILSASWRHQLAVLARNVDRPHVSDDDRSLLAAIAHALPRSARTGWLVTPDTLSRQPLSAGW